MGLIIKKNTAWAVEEEVTEGTYVAPSGVTSYVQPLADGDDLQPSKELLERNINNTSIGKSAPVVGMRQATGNLPVECKANSTAGGEPEFDKLIRSAVGNRRQISSTTTTKSSGNTGSVLQIEDADISKFNKHDIILIKESGAYHVSPISAVDSTGGAANITLKIAKPSGSFSNSVVIEKSTIYYPADSGHKALSITRYLENAVREYAAGAKVKSMSLEGFGTGQMPTLKFAFEGMDYDKSVSSLPHTPTYLGSKPPIILDARMYIDTTATDVNEITLNLENALAWKTSIAAANGRQASRVSERTISCTFNPYQDDGSVANYTKYNENTAFSLFAYAKLPTGVTGQFGSIVAIWLPNCNITNLATAEKDGLMQDQITASANRGVDGSTDEIFIAFI